MSIEFFCPDGQVAQFHRECSCVEDPQEWLPGTHSCGYCRGGVWPEFRRDPAGVLMSTATAMTVVAALGLPVEDEGVIEVGDLPAVLRRILRLLNVPNELAAYARPASMRHNPRSVIVPGTIPRIERRGARMVDFGVDVERIERQLRDLAQLLSEASARGLDVIWQ